MSFLNISDKHTQGQYLNYTDEGPVSVGSKTRRFAVTSRHTGSLLGYVKWYVQWRQYCFFPLNAIFDKSCLREIADFCHFETEKQKESWSKR